MINSSQLFLQKIYISLEVSKITSKAKNNEHVELIRNSLTDVLYECAKGLFHQLR